MTKLNTIVRFLNKELRVSKIKDYSRNGLQVRGKPEVKKIAFAVDACMETFEKAKKKSCDLIFVHHGLLWKGDKRDEVFKKRINYLKRNKISLYGVHAPLDCHPKLGNNTILAGIVNAKNLKKFGFYKGIYWGYHGVIKPTPLRSITSKYNKALNTKCKVLNFGEKTIKKIGFGSGGCGFAIDEAKKKGLNLMVVGEIKHSNYHEAKEKGLNLIIAGHYKSETVGVKAIQELLKQKFNIKTEFIDIPTGF